MVAEGTPYKKKKKKDFALLDNYNYFNVKIYLKFLVKSLLHSVISTGHLKHKPINKAI